MQRYFFGLLLLISCCLQPHKAIACGYNFIGDCSTILFMEVNDTPDSFAMNPCTFGVLFDGLDLGTIRSLKMPRAKVATWESCINNVTDVIMYYRIYKTGHASGVPWQTLNMPEAYFIIEGPYTTRHREILPDLDLTAGLTVGEDYTFEVYFKALIDTVGDDFIPEIEFFQNNNGQNYRLSFTYGGAAAPPFSVVVIKEKDVSCEGDSTGLAAVWVYGNTTGVFITWEGFNQNFYEIFNLPTGHYPVHVSGVGGYSQDLDIVIGARSHITTQFDDIAGASCNGAQGSATAIVSGGVEPYQYAWGTGQTTQTAQFDSGGAWGMTVTDALGCAQATSIFIPGQQGGVVEQNIARSICQGEQLVIGNNTYTQAGAYNATVAGQSGCDTLYHLVLVVNQPDVLLQNIAADTAISCVHPAVTLCGMATGGALFTWKQNNTTVGNTPCFEAEEPGNYTVKVNQGGCQASKSIHIEDRTAPPVGSGFGSGTYSCGATQVSIALQGQSTSSNAQYLWTAPGGWTSQAAAATYTTSNFFSLDSVKLFITNVFGCTAQVPVQISAVQAGSLVLGLDNLHLNCNATYDGKINISGGVAPYILAWSDNDILGDNFTALAAGQYALTVTDILGCSISSEFNLEATTPLSLSPPQVVFNKCSGYYEGNVAVQGGMEPFQYDWSQAGPSGSAFIGRSGAFSLTVTGENGCTATTSFILSPNNDTLHLQLNTTPATTANATNGTADVQVSNGTGPYQYFWNDGSTTAAITHLLPGLYCVTVQDIGAACAKETCQAVSFVNGTFGTVDAPVFLEINPNPVIDLLQINLENINASEGTAHLNIMDGMGRVVFDQPVAILNQTLRLPAVGLPVGMYWVKVWVGPKVWVGKFMKG